MLCTAPQPWLMLGNNLGVLGEVSFVVVDSSPSMSLDHCGLPLPPMLYLRNGRPGAAVLLSSLQHPAPIAGIAFFPREPHSWVGWADGFQGDGTVFSPHGHAFL